jgi:REP element-mobilizing transposase RayT
MAAARKTHVQQELFRRGGKRRGAGRKPTGARPGAKHETRPELDGTEVLHVVLRAVPEVGSLRRPLLYKAIRNASLTAAKRARFRIIHISIQRTHLHLLVEADTKDKLAAGMQGFQISAARNINTVLGEGRYRRRRGRVFEDRYHLVVITTPTQTRRVLAYVMSNWRKHGEDRDSAFATWMVDPYSSGRSFPDWAELDGNTLVTPIEPTYGALIVSEPHCWLLRAGWKLAGPISAFARPGPRPTSTIARH